MKHITKILMALVIALAFVGAASAAVLPNATPETQTISSQTVVQCDGIVMSNEQYTGMDTNQALNGAPLSSGEVYSQNTYNNQITAVNGQTTYVKSIDVNTKNQVGTGKNVATSQVLTFTGAVVVGDESASIFNAGQATSGTDKFLCPFTSAATTTVPPFNEMVTLGSHFDATTINQNSQMGITSVAASGDVPSSINYNIGATGQGSISTFMNILAQDGRGDGKSLVSAAKTTTTPGKTTTVKTDGYWNGCKWVPGTSTTTVTKDVTTTTPAVYTTVPSSQIAYSEKTSAMGTFVFGKNMQYVSKVTA